MRPNLNLARKGMILDPIYYKSGGVTLVQQLREFHDVLAPYPSTRSPCLSYKWKTDN